MTAYDALEQHYLEIIDKMPHRFNSHEFILKLAYHHQHLYVKALAQYANKPKVWPFQVVHGELARRLGSDRFSHIVRYVGHEPSTDIFGHSNEAALWVKQK